jgi:hypothetical protein
MEIVGPDVIQVTNVSLRSAVSVNQLAFAGRSFAGRELPGGSAQDFDKYYFSSSAESRASHRSGLRP